MTQGNGRNFNEQVEATAFAGEIRADVKAIREDVKVIRVDFGVVVADVKIMKERQDKFLGVIAVGAFAVPLIMRALWP